MTDRCMTCDYDEGEYEEYLNEILGDVQVGNLTFGAGTIIRELDPTAFRVSQADEECTCEEDAQ